MPVDSDAERLRAAGHAAPPGGAVGGTGPDLVCRECGAITDTDPTPSPCLDHCVAAFRVELGGRDSSEPALDPRGFAVKFRTEDGNWDMVVPAPPVRPTADAVGRTGGTVHDAHPRGLPPPNATGRNGQ